MSLVPVSDEFGCQAFSPVKVGQDPSIVQLSGLWTPLSICLPEALDTHGPHFLYSPVAPS